MLQSLPRAILAMTIACFNCISISNAQRVVEDEFVGYKHTVHFNGYKFDHVHLSNEIDFDFTELRFENCKFVSEDIVQYDDDWTPPDNYPNKAAMKILKQMLVEPHLTEWDVIDFYDEIQRKIKE